MSTPHGKKQQVTLSLSGQSLKKARILAAERRTSLSEFLARETEVLVSRAEQYELAKQQAMALLDQGFHMGGVIRANRDDLRRR